MAVKSNLVLALVLVISEATAVRAQEPPLPLQLPPPVPLAEPLASPVPPAGPVVLSEVELRQRRDAIFLLEGVLAKAVRLGAAATAREIQNIQPGIRMFTTAPVKAHGTYLEGYGVFFQVEIPQAMSSVVNLIESVTAASQLRAQPAAVGGRTPDPMAGPDAHYVESVKRQLVDAMLEYSRSLQLRPEEWLTVAAREAEEAPGQIEEPSLMVLRIQGADLSEFLAGRLTPVEVRKRVQVRRY
ncbi:MAG: hypothetical protein WEB50_09060 [Vicinamibacterales bacterium]